MADDTIRIDDHPHHWRATLLGEDFWKDAEEFNERTNNDIDEGEPPSDFYSDTLLIKIHRP